MRRRHRDEETAPAWVLEYRSRDWRSGAVCHPECAYWAAVRRWSADHPDVEIPPGVGPDTPFHLEVL